MSTIEVTVDKKPVDLAPVDPNVIIPDHVKRAAELANSFYAKPDAATPSTPEDELPTGSESVPAESKSVADSTPPVDSVPTVQAPPLVPPQTPNDVITPTKEQIHESEWAARYNSMKGRYDAAQRTIGSMQEQMSQLGDELMRTQQLLRGQEPAQQSTPSNHGKLITPEDEQAYGADLIDLTRRAARETVGPEIQQLREENRRLQKSQITRAQSELKQRLAAEMPNWQEVNQSPDFINWLRLPNVYTGQVRKQMLNAAYEAADAPKVIAFFKDYLREGDATGQRVQTTAPEQLQVPRQAAMSLDTLAAPGRAKPATGNASPSLADKPVITHAQIKEFYANVRRGYYDGRENDKAQHEAMIFSAQREGRVR